MNKITVVNDIPKIIDLDDNIEFELLEKNELFEVNTINLKIKKDTSLNIIYEIEESTKININITVLEHANFKLHETKKGKKVKSQYKYYLNTNSTTAVYKYHDVETIKELININLDGVNAKIDYNFKTIAVDNEKYDFTIYHNHNNTISNIKNNGVNIEDGTLIFNVSSFVPNNKTDCNVNQTSRIINLTNNKCQINPNLFIDEYNVSASHSALIGRFSEEEMFYLKSRGIDETTAEKLLIRGFLISDFDETFIELIDKNIYEYWR